MSRRLEVGRWGERIARTVLSAAGYQILESNFHSRFGEVDLLCRDGATLVVIEVKTRLGRSFGAPVLGISENKLLRLAKTMSIWQCRMGWEAMDIRIDCVGIERLAEHFFRYSHVVGVGPDEENDELD